MANELGVDNSDPSKTNPPFIPDSSPLSSNKDSTHCLWRSTGQFPPLTTTQPNFLITIQSPDESLKIPQISNGIPNSEDNVLHQRVKEFQLVSRFQLISIGFYRFAGEKKFSFVEPALV